MVRVHKHTNPLNFRKEDLSWQFESLFNNKNDSLQLEIGSAQGEFLFEMAKNNPQINFLGFEVRSLLVDKLTTIINDSKLENIKIVCSAAPVHLFAIPDRSISEVYIFFPDPWFKTRHHKRRILSPKFVSEISPKLKDKHAILFQTDVAELYEDTLGYLEETKQAEIIYSKIELGTINETGVASYYESRCLKNNWPIHRIKLKLHS